MPAGTRSLSPGAFRAETGEREPGARLTETETRFTDGENRREHANTPPPENAARRAAMLLANIRRRCSTDHDREVRTIADRSNLLSRPSGEQRRRALLRVAPEVRGRRRRVSLGPHAASGAQRRAASRWCSGTRAGRRGQERLSLFRQMGRPREFDIDKTLTQRRCAVPRTRKSAPNRTGFPSTAARLMASPPRQQHQVGRFLGIP